MEKQPVWGTSQVAPQVCEPFVKVIIPVPLNKTQLGADLSAGTLSSGLQITLSTASLAPCVLSGSGSSLVVSPGYLVPPILNPPVPSHPFLFLIDCLPSSAACSTYISFPSSRFPAWEILKFWWRLV